MVSPIRVGTVSSVDPNRGTARILFDDLDGLVSYDMPVLFSATLKNRGYHMPDVGEQVVCAFLNSGMEQGFILGSIYSSKDPVPVSDKDVWHLSIPGGCAMEVNRRTREAMFVDSYGSRIVLRSGDIILKSLRNIHLNPSSVPIPAHLSTIFD